MSQIDASTPRIEFGYEFASESSQRGTFEISFDGGANWNLLLDLDSDNLTDNTIVFGVAQYDAGDDFRLSPMN